MVRALRLVLVCLAVVLPAVALRVSGVHPAAPVALLVFGAAVVAASFVLACAAEAGADLWWARCRSARGHRRAPEYAVDLYFAYRAGSNPDYVQYAAANMTGSNRLLLGLG